MQVAIWIAILIHCHSHETRSASASARAPGAFRVPCDASIKQSHRGHKYIGICMDRSSNGFGSSEAHL
jgi:hypothetical protein